MNKQTEALKLALEALETLTQYNMVRANIFRRFEPTCTGDYVDLREFREKAEPTITTLREALAEQPAQADGDTIVQTFTGLPKRKLRELLSGGWEVNGVCFQRIETDGTVRRGAATTGGMVLWWNAERPAQQEPVEVQMRVGNSYWSKVDRKTPAEQLAKAQQLMRDNPGVYQMRKLYTSPPAQRTWVGLTIEEMNEMTWGKTVYEILALAEAKLKEKNS